ncbi:hypothetical protein ACFWAP_09090 [Streptomyces goshikiensis]|uniref:hypothetical protein n=1 Tax=Streptomyces goshikiensis TaxID=1942 RepID=UPI00364C9E26
MTDVFTATDTEALVELLALSAEGLALEDLHPSMASGCRSLASRLAIEGHPRDLDAITEVIALDFEGAGHIDQIGPWVIARYRATAQDILNQF